MKSVVGVVVAAAVVLGGLAGCTVPAGEAAERPDVVEASKSDEGGNVALEVGQTLRVVLQGNPTTGYTWMAAELPECLRALGEPGFVADTDAAGSGGTMTLEYEAVSAGTGTLTLWYARPWESVQPLETYTMEITVR